MEATFKIANPGDVPCTLEMAMTLREWSRLKDQLAEIDEIEATQVHVCISNMIRGAEKHFYAKTDVTKPGDVQSV